MPRFDKKSPNLAWIKIPIDHLSAAAECNLDREFSALIRKSARIQGPVMIDGLEMLISEGIVLRDDNGLIPVCVAETIGYISACSTNGKKSSEVQKSHKSLMPSSTLQAPCKHLASTLQAPSNQMKGKEMKRNELDTSYLVLEGKKERSKPSDFPDEFLAMWKETTPESRSRSGVASAFKAWNESGAAKHADRALLALKSIAQSKGWREGYAPGLHRWLKDGGWMAEPEAGTMTLADRQRAANNGDNTDYLEGSKQ